jgi:hypothetical protein
VLATRPVVTKTLALVAPAATETLAGTGTAVELLLASITTAPPEGALPFSVTLTVTTLPPTVVDGVTVRVEIPSGPTVTEADFETLPYDAVIVADVDAETLPPLIMKVADNAPAGTVTVEGTTALTLLLLRATTVPPDLLGPDNFTVPVAELPETTDVGLIVIDESPTGFMVSVAVLVTPP